MLKVAFLLLFALSSSVYGETEVEWTDPQSGTYFNFGSLKRDPNNPWKIKDGADNGLFSMVYFFNFGANHNQKCKKYSTFYEVIWSLLVKF